MSKEAEKRYFRQISKTMDENQLRWVLTYEYLPYEQEIAKEELERRMSRQVLCKVLKPFGYHDDHKPGETIYIEKRYIEELQEKGIIECATKSKS